MFKSNKRNVFLLLGVILVLIFAYFVNVNSGNTNEQNQAVIESLTTLSLTTESQSEMLSTAQLTTEASDQVSAEPSETTSQATEINKILETSTLSETAQVTGADTSITTSRTSFSETTTAPQTTIVEPVTMDINPDTGKDKYRTDPVPEGKPLPVEWQDVEIDTSVVYHCSLSVDCKTILNNMDIFNQDKLEVLPQDGVILPMTSVQFYKGESVFNVLQREMKRQGIHMEFNMTPLYNSVYIEGINNLYEFDTGDLSGWMYRVNGWYPNYGASRYQLKDGDVVEWIYTCDLGRDIGGSVNMPKE